MTLGPKQTRLRDLIVGVLEDNHRRSFRVQANKIVQLLDAVPAGVPAVEVVRPEPARWAKYAARNQALLDDGFATTRNRTRAAMEALGLVPDEVRAVVIEPHVIFVFRWGDEGERVGIGQPIIEDLEDTA